MDLFKQFLNSTKDFVFVKDSEGKYLASSKPDWLITNLKADEEIIGKYDYELFDSTIVRVFLMQDKKVLEENKTVVDTNWLENSAKEKVLIETIKSPLYGENGEIVGIQGVSRDVTKREQISNELTSQKNNLQIILDNIPLAVWIKDKNNNYIVVNKEYETFYGVNRNEIKGSEISRILKSKGLFSENSTKLLTMQDKDVFNNLEKKQIILWTEGERRRHVEIVKTPILKSSGECIGLLGISYEVD